MTNAIATNYTYRVATDTYIIFGIKKLRYPGILWKVSSRHYGNRDLFFLKLSGHVTAAVCYGEREPKLSIVSRENKPFELIRIKNDDFDNSDDQNDSEANSYDDDTDKAENTRNKIYIYFVDHQYEEIQEDGIYEHHFLVAQAIHKVLQKQDKNSSCFEWRDILLTALSGLTQHAAPG